MSLLFTSQLAGAGVLAQSMGAHNYRSVRVEPIELTQAFALTDFKIISPVQDFQLVSHTGSIMQASIWQASPNILGRVGYRDPNRNKVFHLAVNVEQSLSAGTAALVSEAMGAVRSAPGSTGHQMGRLFDGSKENIKVFLVQAGQSPIGANLKDLPTLLTPHFLSAFNRNGHVRLVRGDGRQGTELTPAKTQDVFNSLELLGLSIKTKRVRSDSVPMSNEGPSGNAQSSKEKNKKTNYSKVGVAAGIVALGGYQFGIENLLGWVAIAGLAMNALRIIAEIRYIGRILRASFRDSQSPLLDEIIWGVIWKIVPALGNIRIFIYTFSGISSPDFGMIGFFESPISDLQILIQLIPRAVEAHPVAFVCSVVLSLAVEAFHGIWVNTWSNFQSNLRRLRSIVYQNIFNLIYGAVISGSFRLISYLALPGISSPWSFEYWGLVGMMMIIGTSFGTLGMSGLNSIYEKGIIPRRVRSSIQQIRDFVMVITGPLLSTGSLITFQIVFWFGQSLDLVIYITDRFLKTRPIIYIAYESVAESEDFKKMCLNAPLPLKQVVTKFVNKLKDAFGRRAPGSRKAE
jgi:hypothetical protein